MAEQTAAELRAMREREQYNEGLQRKTYDKLLSTSHDWFRDDRRARARELLADRLDGRLLELGSYTWLDWLERNDLTARDLTCINISEVELERGDQRARQTNNKPRFMLMDAQALDFPDGHFDAVFGLAILHHLDFRKALTEIERVLKPDGVMFFAEPMDLNPVGRVVRRLTPKARTVDERPFRLAELRMLDEMFDCVYRFEGMTSVPIGALTAVAGLPSRNVFTRGGHRIDRAIAGIPGLRLWCRYVFLEGRKKRPAGRA